MSHYIRERASDLAHPCVVCCIVRCTGLQKYIIHIKSISLTYIAAAAVYLVCGFPEALIVYCSPQKYH